MDGWALVQFEGMIMPVLGIWGPIFKLGTCEVSGADLVFWVDGDVRRDNNALYCPERSCESSNDGESAL